MPEVEPTLLNNSATASATSDADAPLVSTIIATRNRAKLLEQALDSALSQPIPGRHQIIVVDDSSTDETADTVALYPSVEYICVTSGKPSRTRNAGIKHATGKYIAFLDDDDVWLPERFTDAISLLEADDALGMVYGQATMASFDLQEQGHSFPELPLADGHPVRDFLNVVIHLNTVLVRRTVFERVGLLNEATYSAEDMDLTVRIARDFKVAAIQRSLALIRARDPKNVPDVSGQTQHWKERASDDLNLLRHHMAVNDQFQPSPKQRAAILFRRAGWYAHMMLGVASSATRQRNRAEAIAALQAALSVSALHALRSPAFYNALLDRPDFL